MKSFKNKPSLWKTLSESGGFSLAEVMVAAGILGILSLAITEMTSNIAKSQRTMEQKFELGSILNDVEFALRSRIACERTLSGRVVAAGAGTAFTEIRDSSSINRVILSSVPGAVANTLGNNSNGFTVTQIRLVGFVNELVAPTAAGYIGNTAGTHFTVVNTVDGTGAPVTLRDGLALIRVTFTKGFVGQAGRTATEQANFQNLLSTGNNVTVHNFRVRVMTTTGNAVVSCQSGDTQILQAACASLGGIFTPGDGRCREIEIFEDPTDAASVYGVKASNSLKVVGGVTIGVNNAAHPDANLPPAGSLQVQTTAAIGGAATVTGNINALANVGIGGNADAVHRLRVMGGTSRFDDPVGIGINADPLPYVADTHRLRVQGRAMVSGNVGIGDVAETAHRLRVMGGSARFQNGNSAVFINVAAGTNNTLNINPSAGIFQEMLEGTTPRVRINDSGMIEISNTNLDTAGQVKVEIGGVSIENANYRPVRVFNQPLNNASAATSTFRAINSEIDAELTTKAWVRRMVFGTFYESDPTKIRDVIANMALYAQHQPWDSVSGAICTSIRVRNVGVNTTSYTSCTFDGTNCNCPVRDCSTAGSACVALHTGTIDTTGNATIGGFATVNGRVTAGAHITAGTYIEAALRIVAGTYIQAGTYVVAPKIVASSADAGGGPWGSSGGICGTHGCATRFGKQHCPQQGVVVGIHRGQIACARQRQEIPTGGSWNNAHDPIITNPTFAN